jgi:hypothetical protein
MMTTQEEISKRAREIWEREGRPEGRDLEHWLKAEAELREQSLASENGSGNNGSSPAGKISNREDTMLKVAAAGQKEDMARKRTARRAK